MRTHGLLAVAIGSMMLAGLGAGVVRAQEQPELPPMVATTTQEANSEELLKQGLAQLKAGQYEEALSALQMVNAEELSSKQQKQYQQALGQAETAVQARQAARSDFEAGEAALSAGNPQQAIADYKKARDAKLVDEGTKRKAREQIAVAERMVEQQRKDQRELYQQAVREFDSGNLSDAREKFARLAEAGYNAGLFKRSAADFVTKIDAQLAAQQPAVAENVPSAETPAVDIPTVATPEAAPAEQAPVAQTPEAAPVAAAPEAAPTEVAAPEQAPVKSSREVYQEAVRDYEAGNLAAAREKFQQLANAGYRAGVFKRSAGDYVKKIDARMAAQQQAVAEQAPVEQAPAVAPAESAAAAPKVEAAPAPVATPAPAPKVEPAPVVAQPAPARAPEAPKAPVVVVAPAAESRSAETTTMEAPAAVNPRAELEATAQLERIRQQQRSYEASVLVDQALAAERENRVSEALSLYTRATELDASNGAAREGRDRLLVLQGRAPERQSLLEQQESLNRARREAIRFSFNSSLQNAQSATAAGDFAAAQAGIEAARVARDTDPTIFTSAEVSEMNAALASAEQSLARAQESARNETQRQATAETVRNEQARARAESEQRRATIADLIRTSQRLIQENKYREALGVIDQILVLDANNEYALGVRGLVEDRALLQEQRNFRETFDRQFTRQLNAVEERKIPYEDIYRYPTNWPDISEMRDREMEEEQGVRQADAAVYAQLERRLPEVRFDAVGFSDVIDFLRDVTGANIFVNWRALEAAAIERNTPVTARLRDVKFSKALQTILADVSGGGVKLGYTVGDGVITISTEEDLAANVVTRVYDIRDLAVDVPEFTEAPDFSLSSTVRTSGSGGGGGGGSGLFSGSGTTTDEEEGDQQERIEELRSLIQETVAPDSWRDNGGTVGTVRELSGQLIITQTPENQRAISDLLAQLRERRAVQVSIEARFLTVQRNFLEDVGMDFDFIFNPEGSSHWSPISVQQDSGSFTQGVSTSAPDSIAGRPAGEPQSLRVGGQFMDDFQVNFLLRATQASETSTLLTAPRVTLFNGQRAYVLVATQTAYISDLEPVVAEGVVGYDVTVDVIESGVLLDVEATVSSDRKYVTLTLRPQLARLVQLLPFAFVGSGSSTQPSAGNVYIQQPILQVTQVRTTVNVPDGGTLMLGGQTVAGEVEREAGVPILSKIPFLKRLFTNRSMAKDEQILLILVKPTIIIQREQEQRQFPLLSTRVVGS